MSLAANYVELLRDLRDARATCAAYRELLHMALSSWHEAERRVRQLEQANARYRDETRRLRAIARRLEAA